MTCGDQESVCTACSRHLRVDVTNSGARPGRGASQEGGRGANLIFVEFLGLTSAVLLAFHLESYPAIKQEYLDTGKDGLPRYVDLPLESIHKQAFSGGRGPHWPALKGSAGRSRALCCANQKALEAVERPRRALGLDVGSSISCMGAAHAQKVGSLMGLAPEGGAYGSKKHPELPAGRREPPTRAR